MADFPILVVDDDPDIREHLALVLQEGGYSVVTAGTAHAALAQITKRPDTFRALVADVDLRPGPDGWELAREARGAVPNLAVIYVTGGRGSEWPREGVPNSLLLQKPFAPAQLVTAISSLLTQADMQQAAHPPPSSE